MARIAALLACFNRKALTLQCLQQLFAQQGQDSFSLSIYLVDDGCTDGTAEAVKQQFPSVNIITGTGSLFWNGGMRLAWETALQHDYDFYLWANDDTMIYPDAIQRLLADYHDLLKQGKNPGALVGTMVDPVNKTTTYGGHRIKSVLNHLNTALMEPGQQTQPCDVMDGNLVLVPRKSVKTIGILNNRYKHAYGDYDYSFRLNNAGLSCWTGSAIHGECQSNPIITLNNAGNSISSHLDHIKKIERLYPYQDHMYFVRQFSGPFWPFWWLKALIRGKFPWLWVLMTRKQ